MPIAGYNPFGPLALRFPAAYVGKKENAADRLVQTSQKGSTPLDNPLYRKVDLWMLAIGYAVATDLAVSDSSEGLERFVDGTVLQHDPDRIALLEMLAISHAIDQTDDSDASEEKVRELMGSPRDIIDIANRYAAAGIEEVLNLADPAKGKPLWLLTDKYYELCREAVGEPLQD